MVYVGVDVAQAKRFCRFSAYKRKTLLRLFSNYEISYCLEIPKLCSERFAARFCAKEALLKALSQAYPLERFNLFQIFRNAELSKKLEVPVLIFNFQKFNLIPLYISVSIAHSEDVVIATVILSEN